MRMVEALVRESDNQLSGSAQVLQKILVAAADENGRWQVPLPPEKLEAMKKARHPSPNDAENAVMAQSKQDASRHSHRRGHVWSSNVWETNCKIFL